MCVVQNYGGDRRFRYRDRRAGSRYLRRMRATHRAHFRRHKPRRHKGSRVFRDRTPPDRVPRHSRNARRPARHCHHRHRRAHKCRRLHRKRDELHAHRNQRSGRRGHSFGANASALGYPRRKHCLVRQPWGSRYLARRSYSQETRIRDLATVGRSRPSRRRRRCVSRGVESGPAHRADGTHDGRTSRNSRAGESRPRDNEG